MSQFVQFCTYLKKTFLMNFIWTLKIRCFLTTKMQHLTKSLPSNGLKIKHINFPLHLNQRKRYSKDFFFERLLLKTLWFGGKPKSLYWSSLDWWSSRSATIKSSFEYFTESWERYMTTQLAMSVFKMSDDNVENKTCN